MWEWFGYYGMCVLLMLYLIKYFVFGDCEVIGLYGGYIVFVYLMLLIGGYLVDQYFGFKCVVKFGVIIMVFGYFLLCFGGEIVKFYVMIENQCYVVQVEEQVGSEVCYLVDYGSWLKIKGNDDGIVLLFVFDDSVVWMVVKGGFVLGVECSDFYVVIMLIVFCMVLVGNGFFKFNILMMVGELYVQGDW